MTTKTNRLSNIDFYQRRLKKIRPARIFRKIIFYLLVIIVVLITLSPILLAAKTAFQPAQEISQYPPILIPKHPTLDNFKNALQNAQFLHFIQNTTILGLATIILTLPAGALAAFALARFRFKGQRLFSQSVLILYMFPSVLLLIPLYLLYFRWDLIDKHIGLVFAYTTFALPFTIWLLEAFFSAIPIELDEAAMVDGCTRLGTLFRIVLPLSLNGLTATAVFVFMLVWGEYIFTITFLNTESKRTVATGLNTMVGNYSMDPGLVMAAVMLTTIVPLILFFFIQKYLIEGLTAGALKG
jgi:multiple sugar transport system permease protein